MEKEDKVYLDLKKVPLESERNEKRNKRKRNFLIFLLCLFFFLIGICGGYLFHSLVRPSYEIGIEETLGEIEYMMDHFWLYGEEYEDLTGTLEDKALYGMTYFEDDPYTGYMSEEEMNDFSGSINMNYVGIGVEYSYSEQIAIVKRVFKGSPAEKSGMLAGDILKAIDGKSVEGMTSEDIRNHVLGVEGTEVVITVSRNGEEFDMPIIRGSVSNTIYAYVQDDYVIMELNSFGSDTARECMRYLDEYTDLDKIIIDLRDNSGGYQTSVKQICGLFIGKNQVYLIQKGTDGVEIADYTTAEKTYDNFKKIVILTNENTASAAEVFAICLKEQHPDTTIVGTTTYGKGVIQTSSYLSNGGALKLTSYYWYSPNGVSIHKTGIVPDVEIRMPDIYYEQYYALNEDESYQYDDVDESVRICQMALSFLGYDVSRCDGYFDQSTEKALLEFKAEYNLPQEAALDAKTFETLVSVTSAALVNDPDKDTQMLQAKELIHETNR